MSPGKLRASRVRLGLLGLISVERLHQTARFAHAASTNTERHGILRALQLACISPRQVKTRVSVPRGMFGVARGGATVRQACADLPGRYSPAAGADRCSACPEGRASDSWCRRRAIASGVPGGTCGKCRPGVCVACKEPLEMLEWAAIYKVTWHCVACAKGRYQRYDGSTDCVDYEAGKYIDVEGHSAECRAYQVVDALRIFWSDAGATGAAQCYKKKLDCKVSRGAHGVPAHAHAELRARARACKTDTRAR